MFVGVLNPDMNDLTNRLTSFAQWPNNVAVKPKDLAETGFYYLGRGDDTVRCFSCGITLSGWQIGDIPEEKHRRCFKYFKINRSRLYNFTRPSVCIVNRRSLMTG